MVIPFAVGQGYDVHRFAPGRRLVLGGVEIPSNVGLLGHSDADVVLHALCDAILGAAGLPDIGHFFPNDDPAWKDADSLDLLRAVVQRVTEAGWQLGNADITIVAEHPKVAPHIPAMKEAIASRTGLPLDRIAVKATTNERMGFVGREEGIAALAVVLLGRR